MREAWREDYNINSCGLTHNKNLNGLNILMSNKTLKSFCLILEKERDSLSMKGIYPSNLSVNIEQTQFDILLFSFTFAYG